MKKRIIRTLVTMGLAVSVIMPGAQVFAQSFDEQDDQVDGQDESGQADQKHGNECQIGYHHRAPLLSGLSITKNDGCHKQLSRNNRLQREKRTKKSPLLSDEERGSGYDSTQRSNSSAEMP